MTESVLVRGFNDVASAVALRLRQAGRRVVLQDEAVAPVSRRGMAFADAVERGEQTIERITARSVRPEMIAVALADPTLIPLVVAPVEEVTALIPFDVVVDARMRKRVVPEDQRMLAELTVGLGPNFVAGGNVHVAVETSWDDLGRLIFDGPTLPLSGEPQPIDGHARDRFVYAPAAGTFHTLFAIGDLVVEDEAIAQIGDVALHAPLSGSLRGLVQDGAMVQRGTKVIEVDPRGADGLVSGIGRRPDAIAQAVVQLLHEVPSR